MVTWTIAKTTFGEAMRKKVLNVFLIVAVFMTLLVVLFSPLAFQQDLTVVKSLGLMVIMAAGLVISLIMGISLVPNEIERRTIYTILSKPVRRYEFLLGKFLGAALTLLVNIGLMGIVFIAVVAIKVAIGGDAASLSKVGEAALKEGGAVASKLKMFDISLILGVVLIYFQFFLLTAVVMFLSIFLTPTVNFFAGAGVWLIGIFSSVWTAMSQNKSEEMPIALKYFYLVISKAIPNFDYFNIQNKLIHPHIEVRSMPVYIAFVIGYSLFFSAVLMLIALLSFEKKEV